MDAQASEERLQTYLSAGLTLLNVAGFVVPVLGQLMAGVAVGQLLGEVFDGVEDWAHHRTADALKHLSNVGQSLASMAAFAVEGASSVRSGAARDHRTFRAGRSGHPPEWPARPVAAEPGALQTNVEPR
ncbi:hypothetical protein VRC34_16630 [Pseudomonas poae]